MQKLAYAKNALTTKCKSLRETKTHSFTFDGRNTDHIKEMRGGLKNTNHIKDMRGVLKK